MAVLRTEVRSLLGKRATLLRLDIFGEPYEIAGTVMSFPEAHGFLTPGGGWSMYGGDPAWPIAWRFVFRVKRKHRQRWIFCHELEGIKEGWS